MTDLHTLQAEAGGTFDPDTGRVLSYGCDEEAIAAAMNGVALTDRSHWGLLRVTGDDRLEFLHNQSTNDIRQLQPGTSCETVFVTSTARTIDLATVYATEDALLLLVSPSGCQTLPAWLDRYLFPADRVEIDDVSAHFAVFDAVGPGSRILLGRLMQESLNADADRPDAPQSVALPAATHRLLTLKSGTTVRISPGCGLELPGFTAIVPRESAWTFWECCIAVGARPLGDRAWERLRVTQGRPMPGSELTDDYNPLEAGLLRAISFDKGCYIGQETIARLKTYDGVKQKLWGVQLAAPIAPGTPILQDGKKVGIATSVVPTADGAIALAYVRTKLAAAGMQLTFGGANSDAATGELVSVPFLAFL
ncbi:folate-binding protein YgfZ [Rubidibacter lacunae KORDI 51-2]|uniref:Folate-binding protein YgfZ n=1 Tax=Rubidibacter lacunae KORDI 51-2 TaxID=582515 RepID=U5DHF3_9CHRO|nr:glycine cleavage T C-terminal barrel domain-containing protein [Rubidibacter lacunae]ERN40004.1 folate-binding protein YgfZ [Rubidibacter lacunae KORDI 51-2]